MIRFKEKLIRCGEKHSSAIYQPPQLMASRAYYWATNKTGEIVGGRGMRPVSFEVWIADGFQSLKTIDTYLKTLDELVGENGTIVYTSAGESFSHKHCTFDGFMRSQQQGRSVPKQDPLYNSSIPIANQVGPGGYWIEGILQFTQLTAEDD